MQSLSKNLSLAFSVVVPTFAFLSAAANSAPSINLTCGELPIGKLTGLSVRHFSVAHKLLAQADSSGDPEQSLYHSMDEISQFFMIYAKTKGEFPSNGGMGGGSVVGVVQSALAGNSANPYYAGRNELIADQALRDKVTPGLDFHLANDDAIMLDKVDEYRSNAPESWKTTPGTIMGETDKQENWVIFWAAGADGKPLRNAQGVRLIVIQLPKK